MSWTPTKHTATVIGNATYTKAMNISFLVSHIAIVSGAPACDVTI